MRLYHHILLITVFVVVLFGILLGSHFKWDFYEMQNENRRLAEFPNFDEIALEDWPSAFEPYFNDHFGFRNTFIRKHNRLMKKAGKSTRVINGSDGWLYYNTSDIIKDFIGYRKQIAIDPEIQCERLISRRDWLKSKGVEYLLVIVPNKLTIYSEYLPEHILEIKAETHRQALLEALGGRFDRNHIDLTPTLLESKEDEVVYLRTDTHWNPKGAYIGYSSMVDKISTLLPDFTEKLALSELTSTHRDYTGDLATMSGDPGKHPLVVEFIEYSGTNEWSRSILTNAAFITEENMPLTDEPPYTIHNPNGKYNAVVFHDSFMGSMSYLPHLFKNTTFIWRYSSEERLQLAIEHCQPDIIIEEVVERFLVDKGKGALLDTVRLPRD